jgi:hypothetical protein
MLIELLICIKEDAGRYLCQVNSNPMITQVGIVDVVGIQFLLINFNNWKIKNSLL